jgi:hypothetical protein
LVCSYHGRISSSAKFESDCERVFTETKNVEQAKVATSKRDLITMVKAAAKLAESIIPIVEHLSSQIDNCNRTGIRNLPDHGDSTEELQKLLLARAKRATRLAEGVLEKENPDDDYESSQDQASLHNDSLDGEITGQSHQNVKGIWLHEAQRLATSFAKIASGLPIDDAML